jgi:ligand-binding SRPBCC domain-containing protein
MIVKVSDLINAPIEKVWETVRPFDSLKVWHPMVADCVIDNDKATDQLGAIRNIYLTEGDNVVRETLIAMSDLDHEFMYDIIEGMPFYDYIARVQFKKVDENRTYAYWEVHCMPKDDMTEEEGRKILEDVFSSGFKKLNTLLS